MKAKPLSDKVILKNVSIGSRRKKIGEDGKTYFYIYKVINSRDNKVFVSGCMSEIDPDTDKHISKSIYGRKPYEKHKIGNPCYGSYLRLYPKHCFKRTDLLFLNNLDELLEVEKLIVDEDFKVNDKTMNYGFSPQYAEILRFAKGEFLTPEYRIKLAAIKKRIEENTLDQALLTIKAIELRESIENSEELLKKIQSRQNESLA